MVDIMTGVQQMYDEIGTHFSRTRQKTYGSKSSNWPITDLYLKKLVNGDSVLDIGCGNGKLISGLPEGVKYLGTDFSKTLLDEAKFLHPDHEFVFGNVAETSHWKNLGTYQAIFCVAVLHHVPGTDTQLEILKHTKKHLAKGGFLYLTVWNLWQEKFLQYQVDDHFEVPYNNNWTRYCVAYDISSLTNLMIEAGFDVQELFYAEREGMKSDLIHGENLVCVAT